MSQSVLKAIKLLDCFTTKSELTLIELSDLSKMPKTTVFRLVSSLEEGGLLVKVRNTSHDVKYRLGLKLLEIGNRVQEQLEYRKVAFPHIKKLNEELNELVHMVVLEGDEAVYVEKIDSTKPVRLVVKVGRRSPLYAGSAPKLLLASMDDPSLEEYLSNLEIKKITNNTIDNIDDLKEEIQNIRNRGYSFSRAEHFKDTIGFSYPIYDYTGKTVAALGVSIPINDYSKEREIIILEKTKEAAQNIWRDLGYHGF
ncbi:IclR family transcriptional regulator [Halobacillus shinanisalinarum]|uniref:IclR family transcriptional regulator n=1 Tax=Halobacillus shinanisalinarum TaxID=2932258 RepID=A0ABY4GYB9_9BACI|nr:IclR family transcriptional regulator [Halobacillus shinanisalinarum]UOQ93163.1 IclR family transcriptional regulator [Halobacillus shinanisalinarum]